MSLLSWFKRKGPSSRTAAPDSSGFSVPASERPSSTGPGGSRAEAGDSDCNDCQECPNRQRQDPEERAHGAREWLYSVVREAMRARRRAHRELQIQGAGAGRTRPPVPGDGRPRPRWAAHRPAVQDRIADHPDRHRRATTWSITAVYWRTNDHVAVGLPRTAATASGAGVRGRDGQARQCRWPIRCWARRRNRAVRTDPGRRSGGVQAALAEASGQPPAPGEVVRSGPRSKPSDSGYEDTEMQPPDKRPDALSATQYGDIR
jgi:hypothetical protein